MELILKRIDQLFFLLFFTIFVFLGIPIKSESNEEYKDIKERYAKSFKLEWVPLEEEGISDEGVKIYSGKVIKLPIKPNTILRITTDVVLPEDSFEILRNYDKEGKTEWSINDFPLKVAPQEWIYIPPPSSSNIILIKLKKEISRSVNLKFYIGVNEVSNYFFENYENELKEWLKYVLYDLSSPPLASVSGGLNFWEEIFLETLIIRNFIDLLFGSLKNLPSSVLDGLKYFLQGFVFYKILDIRELKKDYFNLLPLTQFLVSSERSLIEVSQDNENYYAEYPFSNPFIKVRGPGILVFNTRGVFKSKATLFPADYSIELFEEEYIRENFMTSVLPGSFLDENLTKNYIKDSLGRYVSFNRKFRFTVPPGEHLYRIKVDGFPVLLSISFYQKKVHIEDKIKKEEDISEFFNKAIQKLDYQGRGNGELIKLFIQGEILKNLGKEQDAYQKYEDLLFLISSKGEFYSFIKGVIYQRLAEVSSYENREKFINLSEEEIKKSSLKEPLSSMLERYKFALEGDFYFKIREFERSWNSYTKLDLFQYNDTILKKIGRLLRYYQKEEWKKGKALSLLMSALEIYPSNQQILEEMMMAWWDNSYWSPLSLEDEDEKKYKEFEYIACYEVEENLSKERYQNFKARQDLLYQLLPNEKIEISLNPNVASLEDWNLLNIISATKLLNGDVVQLVVDGIYKYYFPIISLYQELEVAFNSGLHNIKYEVITSSWNLTHPSLFINALPIEDTNISVERIKKRIKGYILDSNNKKIRYKIPEKDIKGFLKFEIREIFSQEEIEQKGKIELSTSRKKNYTINYYKLIEDKNTFHQLIEDEKLSIPLILEIPIDKNEEWIELFIPQENKKFSVKAYIRRQRDIQFTPIKSPDNHYSIKDNNREDIYSNFNLISQKILKETDDSNLIELYIERAKKLIDFGFIKYAKEDIWRIMGKENWHNYKNYISELIEEIKAKRSSRYIKVYPQSLYTPMIPISPEFYLIENENEITYEFLTNFYFLLLNSDENLVKKIDNPKNLLERLIIYIYAWKFFNENRYNLSSFYFSKLAKNSFKEFPFRALETKSRFLQLQFDNLYEENLATLTFISANRSIGEFYDKKVYKILNEVDELSRFKAISNVLKSAGITNIELNSLELPENDNISKQLKLALIGVDWDKNSFTYIDKNRKLVTRYETKEPLKVNAQIICNDLEPSYSSKTLSNEDKNECLLEWDLDSYISEIIKIPLGKIERINFPQFEEGAHILSVKLKNGSKDRIALVRLFRLITNELGNEKEEIIYSKTVKKHFDALENEPVEFTILGPTLLRIDSRFYLDLPEIENSIIVEILKNKREKEIKRFDFVLEKSDSSSIPDLKEVNLSKKGESLIYLDEALPYNISIFPLKGKVSLRIYYREDIKEKELEVEDNDTFIEIKDLLSSYDNIPLESNVSKIPIYLSEPPSIWSKRLGTFSGKFSYEGGIDFEDKEEERNFDFLGLFFSYRKKLENREIWLKGETGLRILNIYQVSYHLLGNGYFNLPFLSLKNDSLFSLRFQRLNSGCESSLSLRSGLSRNFLIFPSLYMIPKLGVFFKYQSLNEIKKENALLEVDQDIFSQFDKNHPTGVYLQETLWWKPFLNEILYLRVRETSNPNFNSIDRISLQFGSNSIIKNILLNLSYNISRVFPDENRQKSNLINRISLGGEYFFLIDENRVISLQIKDIYSFSEKRNEFFLGVIGSYNFGRGFKDYPFQEIDFTDQLGY